MWETIYFNDNDEELNHHMEHIIMNIVTHTAYTIITYSNPKKISFHTTDLMMAIRNCMFNYILWRIDISFIIMWSGSADNIRKEQTWSISR